MYDLKLDLATAPTVDSKKWKNTKTTWGKFVDIVAKPVKTRETMREYAGYSKDAQGRIKDAGGYFGGYLRNGKRSPANVVYKQLVCLDLDYAPLDIWQDFVELFQCAAVLHSTHSHTEKAPRYRLILPLDREAAPDEWLAASRQIAGKLGIEYFDETTFDLNRLNFWPSIPKDATYVFEEQEGEPLSLDDILDTYVDWKDVSAWPTNKESLDRVGKDVDKQQDPLEKRGVIGAFCKTYTITEAIDVFLADKYEEGTEGRYTYLQGSTSNGLVIYEDKFAYSHHNTDPAGGMLCNAFDLVRLHKFGRLDPSPTSNLSTKAMEEFARNDKQTKKTIAKELLQSASADFGGLKSKPKNTARKERDEEENEYDVDEEDEEDASEWMADLDADRSGNYLPKASNLNTIFRKDAALKGAFATNEFDNKRYLTRSVPWRRIIKASPFEDVDFSGIRNYIECIYNIAASPKIDDALNLVSHENCYHPIKDFLEPLVWDGVERVDRLLIDYFGADDTQYVRRVARMTLVAAIHRVFDAGCKYDYMLVLVGKQGEAKSQFFKRLALGWFSDSFETVHGQKAFEQMQGAWIIEVAELAGFNKSDVESVKKFLSKQSDMLRVAYGRIVKEYPRQCIFVGTTNEDEFLKDATGNRRFLPVKTRGRRAKKWVYDHLTKAEVKQIWAEAMEYYRDGETIFLSKEEERLAQEHQNAHYKGDERSGVVEEYLERILPPNWHRLGIQERQMFLETSTEDPVNGEERDYVCIAELWCECFGKDKREMSRYNTRDLNDIMKSLPNWEPKNSTKNFPIYGKQKYFERKLD